MKRAETLARVLAWMRVPLRYAAVLLVSLCVFALVLLVSGKNPLRAYVEAFSYTVGNAYGLSELLVRMTPLMLTAVAVTLPMRIGMINVGGEGQLFMGAWLVTAGELGFSGLPPWLLLPLLMFLGFAGGAAWALIPGLLRAWGLVSEIISTLLLNYVAPLIVGYYIFGPWRSSESSSYPQSPAFVEAARLPTFFNTRVNAGVLFALASVLLYWLLMERTRWGLEMRAIGSNPDAARRLGIPVFRYIVAVMAIAGGVAGLAGMEEVSAIQGRLASGLSPGYGFVGFLIAWLAGGNAWGIVAASFLFAVITSAGDILQISQGVPYAVVNILSAVILLIVLGWHAARPVMR